METLTALVRGRAPWPPGHVTESKLKAENEQGSVRVRPATDIQAVLTLLRRRDERMCKQDRAAGRRIDLVATDLRGADLRGAHLEAADLSGAHLEGAGLAEAHLEAASLRGAYLKDTFFGGERIFELEGTFEGRRGIVGHGLEILPGGAHLEGANLRDAHSVTQGQLDSAEGDASTQLPAELTRPSHWPATAYWPPPDEPAEST